MSVKVAAVQGSSVLGETQANAARFAALCREAASAGAKILVLPEAALTGYMSEDLCESWHVPGRPLQESQVSGRTFRAKDPSECAERVPGTLTRMFCDLARELDAYITIPFIEAADTDDGAVYFNTICLASPQGELVAHYRKNNLWPYVDKAWLTAGSSTATVDTCYGRVGLAVCFDVHVMFERYMREDIWALLYCIAWVDSNTPAWFKKHLPERVAAAGYHVVAANWSVSSPAVAKRWEQKGVDGYGYSSIYLSSGRLLATASRHTGDHIVYAELPTCPPVAASRSSAVQAFPSAVPLAEPTFTGRWRSDFYGPMEEQEVEITADGLRAVKVTGDLNVPAGMVTWYTKGMPEVDRSVDAWFRQREDPEDEGGFYWERSSLVAVSGSELRLTLLQGGRLRGSTGKYLRVR